MSGYDYNDESESESEPFESAETFASFFTPIDGQSSAEDDQVLIVSQKEEEDDNQTSANIDITPTNTQSGHPVSTAHNDSQQSETLPNAILI